MRVPAIRLLLAAALAFPLAWAVSGPVRPALADPPHHVNATPDASFNEYVPGAARLEGRLLAPCCWDSSRQTLDIHGSPIANELRREIRHRLKGGETPDAIEADLVSRYTTKILAVPPDNPLPRMGPVLAVALLTVGFFAARMLVRWQKRSKQLAASPALPPGGATDQWDARLDAELQEDDD
jgi:cytochrome c-type biogenesis protein CcmH